jgi:hypothetical protein
MNKKHFDHLYSEITSYAYALMEQEKQAFEKEQYTFARECSAKFLAVNHILDMITQETVSEYAEENNLIV